MIKLVDIFTLILEGSYDAQGVGDKAYEKFHIRTDEPNIKTMAHMQKEVNKPVGFIDDRHGGSYIYLNPIDLSKFETNVRGIIDILGNLYLAQKDGDFTHGDIADAVGLYEDYASGKISHIVRLRDGNNFYKYGSTDDPEDESKMVRLFRSKHPKFRLLGKF